MIKTDLLLNDDQKIEKVHVFFCYFLPIVRNMKGFCFSPAGLVNTNNLYPPVAANTLINKSSTIDKRSCALILCFRYFGPCLAAFSKLQDKEE